MPNISEFKSQLSQGGARSNQFEVVLAFPSASLDNGNAAYAAGFLCSATSVPAVTVENIALSYRGRLVNFAGERTFAEWNVTIINDGNFVIRNALEAWSNKIANFDATNGIVNPRDYQAQMSVNQLDRNGRVLKGYTFYDAYPTALGPMVLAYDNPNIQTFDVTFQYNYYIPNGGTVAITA